MNLRLTVAPEATATIARLAKASHDGRETGGILLGRGPSDHGLIHVMEAGDPGPAAERHAAHFLRDLTHARALAEAAWARSRATWLGEWHTHPRGGQDPSDRDLTTYAKLLANPELDFAVLVSIIVTPRDHGWAEPAMSPWLVGSTPDPEVVVLWRLWPARDLGRQP